MNVIEINLDMLIFPEDPVRREYDEQSIEELAANIQSEGVIQPIKVRPTDDPAYYEVVVGGRRSRAARHAGLETIPAIVEEMDDEAALVQAIAENVQREQMSPVDIAHSLNRLQGETGWSQQEMARRGIGSATWINCHLALLNEEPEVLEKVVGVGSGRAPEGTITERHVRLTRRTLKESSKDRAKILNKAALETLTSEETAEVARIYSESHDDEERQAVLETPYHSPVWREWMRAKAGVARRKALKKSREKEPGESRAVKEYLMALREFRRAVVAAREVRGQFSPEAVQFVKRWHDDIISNLMTLDDSLEPEKSNNATV